MGILSRLLETRAHPSNPMLETRAHPSNPTNWLLYGLSGGYRANSGIDVNEETALTCTAVFAAVRGLSETIASLPLHLYRRLSPRGKERATEHPLYNILHIKPNPEMTSIAFRETIAGHAVMWGTGYAEISRDEAGKVAALWPLLPGSMEVKRVLEELVYVYRLPSGGVKTFASRNILRVSGFSTDGIQGYRPISKGREAIGLSLSLEEYGARFFSNGAKPPAVLEHPAQLSPEAHDRLRTSWEERHMGLSNAHRVAILEEGMKLREFGVTPENAQSLQSRKFQITEIARIFNIPPHMLKDLERATFSNIEHQGLEFVIYCLRPWLVRFEQAYSAQLLTDKELETYFVEHLVDGLLRGDVQARTASYAQGRQWGWLSANDVREMENQNPIEGGDSYLVPLNMVPAELAGKPQPITPAQQGQKSTDYADVEERSLKKAEYRIDMMNSFRPLFVDTIQRTVNREGIALKRAIKKHLTTRNASNLAEWIDEFYRDLPEYVKKTMYPVIRAYAEAIQRAAAKEIEGVVGMTSDLEEFATQYLDAYSNRYIQSSMGQLNALIRDTAPAELENALTQRTDEWEQKKAEKVASRETVQAGNAFASFVFFGFGLGLIWRTTSRKSCPYCRNLNGRRISRGQYFVQAGTDYEPEGADNGPIKIRNSRMHPPLHGGCHCIIVPG